MRLMTSEELIAPEEINELKDGDLIFARFSQNHPRRDHVMIFCEAKDSAHNIIHLLFSGVQYGDLHHYAEKHPRGEYTVIRFSEEVRKSIVSQGLKILGECETLPTAQRSRQASYHFKRYCFYNILPAAYAYTRERDHSTKQEHFSNFSNVKEFCEVKGVPLGSFFSRRNALNEDETANALQYFKYATTYYSADQSKFEGRMTCSQFALFCLVMPELLTLINSENYNKNFKVSNTDKETPLTPELENAIIAIYCDMPLDRLEQLRYEPARQKKQVEKSSTISSAELDALKACLGPFSKLNPKTVITEDLYQFILKHFQSRIVGFTTKSAGEIVSLGASSNSMEPRRNF